MKTLSQSNQPPCRPVSVVHSPSSRRFGIAGGIHILALMVAFFVTAISAHASHFRGASLTWKKLPPPAPANTIEVTVTESWRADFLDYNIYSWGDGTGGFATSSAQVIATGTDATGSFSVIRKVVNHTYSGPGPWTISANGCCRISTLANAANASWNLSSVVDLRNGNLGSPVISSPILLQMVRGGLNTVPLSFADVDGDPVTFRMATSAESAIPFVASAGGNTLSVSSSGILSWDTSFTAVNQLYAVQVVANDNHPGSPVGTSRVFFDFMIQIVDGTLNSPPVATGDAGPFVATVGVPFSNVITGTDVDGGNLTVTHLGLPSGATLTPPSGTNGAQPLAATFNWTPTPADAGSSVGVTIVFTDPGGLQASKSFSISVPSDQPPVANAGADFSVNEGQADVMLDGSLSIDPDGDALSYAWVQLSGGPAVTLIDANSASPTFTAPTVALGGETLSFELTVTANGKSSTDTVSVNIVNVNHPPVADAGIDQSIAEGSPVTLDGSASYDSDSDALAYAWVQVGGTPVVALADANGANPTFTAPYVGSGGAPGVVATLVFELRVDDGFLPTGAESVDQVTVQITNTNNDPIANAGVDQTVDENSGVTLSAALSGDPDSDSLTYAWTQTAGPSVTLTLAGANTVNPTFTAPFVSAGGADLEFEVTVDDGYGGISTDTVVIHVQNSNDPPLASAAQPSVACLWPPNHQMVAVGITGVSDTDNNATITITAVTQDEPTNGLGDGDTAIDAVINTDGTVLLRAERSGKGDGRVYRISFTASDLEGSASGVVKVCVPHSVKKPAIESLDIYDSTN